MIYRDKASGEETPLNTKLIIGADGARSKVGRAEVPGGDKIPYVLAYHEIIDAPPANDIYDPMRCDVIYDGAISPDFYGWVFPAWQHHQRRHGHRNRRRGPEGGDRRVAHRLGP